MGRRLTFVGRTWRHLGLAVVQWPSDFLRLHVIISSYCCRKDWALGTSSIKRFMAKLIPTNHGSFFGGVSWQDLRLYQATFFYEMVLDILGFFALYFVPEMFLRAAKCRSTP